MRDHPQAYRPRATWEALQVERTKRTARGTGDRSTLTRDLYVSHRAIVRDRCDHCGAIIRRGQTIAYDAPDVMCVDCWRTLPDV